MSFLSDYWSNPLPGSSLAPASSRKLVWSQSSLQLGLSKNDVQQSLFFILAGRVLVNPVSFSDFLKVFDLLTFWLKKVRSFSAGYTVKIPEETATWRHLAQISL